MDSVFIVCKITGDDILEQTIEPVYVFDNEEAAVSAIHWLENNTASAKWDDVSFGHWEMPLLHEFDAFDREDEDAFFDMEDE